MRNTDFNINVVGKNRAQGVFQHLSKKRKNVYYYSSEDECVKSLSRHTRIVILEESNSSATLLGELKKHEQIQVIYLSNKNDFTHVIRAVRKGVLDYILKDSYLFFSILKSIQRLENINDVTMNSKYVYFDTCSFKESYPIRFKIAKWFHLF